MDIDKLIEEFKNDISENSDLKNIWFESNYSDFILDKLKGLSAKLNLKSSREYWKIDCIYYEGKNEIKDFGRGTWISKIKVMIEHENFIERAHEEINKLMHWKSEFKILITYYNKKHLKYHSEEPKVYIEKWNEIIKLMTNSNDMNENILIILGNDETKIFELYYKWDNDSRELKLIV